MRKKKTKKKKLSNRQRFWYGVLAGAVVLLLGVAYPPLAILWYANKDETRPADAAIVLGAAVVNNKPSPVFRERIRHGIDLYRSGVVKWLVLTGGRAEGDDLAEAEAAHAMAVEEGISTENIVMETSSTTTRENFQYIKPLLDEAGIRSALIVSDPMHMRRSVTIARDLGIDAYPSPTPTSLYRSFESKKQFLMHEWLYYTTYLLTRPAE